MAMGIRNKPYFLLNPDSPKRLILLADHAGREFPPKYGKLGLTQEDLNAERNLLFDVGVRGITTKLSQRLGLTAVLGRYSRLLIDLNRLRKDSGLIPLEAHGKPIPGNTGVSEHELKNRSITFYDPYHKQIDEIIKKRQRVGHQPMLLAIHSYTPAIAFKSVGLKIPKKGIDISLMYLTKKNVLLKAFRTGLARHPDIKRAENIPYDLRKLKTGSIYRHGQLRGLPLLGIEISIERILTNADEAFWTDLLAEMLTPIL
jgi:predicted N-formylglutamate amidohydrolase